MASCPDSRPLPPCLPGRHFLRPLKAGRTKIPPLRAGRARQLQVCGGGDASDSDDDLEVTLEVDSPEAARDVGVATDAAGGKLETAEPTGGPFREGTSPSSPSTVVPRGGYFRGGEYPPRQ